MPFLDNIAKELSRTSTPSIGKAVEELVTDAVTRRRGHERRWYDNNYFDDGFHFRVISRKTGRVVDHAYQNAGYVERAIPRASRHIRAVANLLFAAEPYPVVYPDRMDKSKYVDFNGQFNQQQYEADYQKGKDIAKKRGIFLTNEWENQELNIKLIDMILLAAKNSVSWLQVYSDPDEQEIHTDVYDAFDVIVYGDQRDYQKLPFITKTCPMQLSEIMKSSLFDPARVKELTPDNKYATSEIKDAYMRARYGTKVTENKNGTIIIKESFLKEVLNDENWKGAVQSGESTGAMEGKSKGDDIMRHVFSAGGVTLKDEYVDYDEYPLIPLQFEPGPLYQVPFIERFIPQNKSLDVIITRLEKWVNAMVVGVYQKRKGETFQVSNFPGGQMVEYETTPLTQMQNGSVGATPFNVIDMLNKFTDEWGASTAGGINAPAGVKSGVAIESIKATEYANLKIPTLMLKKTITEISSIMLERAEKDYLEPKEQTDIQDGEPDYFDVIGQRGYDLSQKINKPLPTGIVPISKDVHFRIEIEPGLGLTMEGKREAMQQIINYMLQLSEGGFVTQEAIKMVVKRFLESFGYGSTSEFMEAMDTGTTKEDMTNDQITKLKIAIIEALKDAGAVGPEMEKRLVDSTKVGVVEALQDTGLTDGMGGTNKPAQAPKGPSESISFKDLPPEGQAQMAAQAGIQLDPQILAQHQAVQQVNKMTKVNGVA